MTSFFNCRRALAQFQRTLSAQLHSKVAAVSVPAVPCWALQQYTHHLLSTVAAQMSSVKPILATVAFGLEFLLIVLQWGFVHQHRTSRKHLCWWVGRCLLPILTEAPPLGILWYEHQLSRAVAPLPGGSEKLVILVALWWNVLTEVSIGHGYSRNKG